MLALYYHQKISFGRFLVENSIITVIWNQRVEFNFWKVHVTLLFTLAFSLHELLESVLVILCLEYALPIAFWIKWVISLFHVHYRLHFNLFIYLFLFIWSILFLDIKILVIYFTTLVLCCVDLFVFGVDSNDEAIAWKFINILILLTLQLKTSHTRRKWFFT